MTAQTKAQRQAAARKAAVTRRRNAEKRSAYRSKVAAREAGRPAASRSDAPQGTFRKRVLLKPV
jgi:hypothetical protein